MNKIKFVFAIIAICFTTSCSFLDSPTGQFILNEAAKETASFLANGGKVDNAWGVVAGLSTITDTISFIRSQKSAAKLVADTTKASVDSPTAINTLASNLGKLVTSNNPTIAVQQTKLIVNGVSQAASAATP